MIQLMQFGYRYLRHRLHGVHNPEEYYSKIGDDVVPSFNNNFTNPNKPLWLNLGYWEKASNYQDACEDMARLLADKGNFVHSDRILDVGFGYGEQDFLWAKEYNVEHINGVNLTKLHVEVANKRLEASTYHNRIRFEIGNATALDFPENSFTKVVALESAFHFSPRQDFFHEAFRVLEPGGSLVIADMASLPSEKIDTRWKTKGRAEMYIPDENAIDSREYCKQIQSAGFQQISCTSIASSVYGGASKYFLLRASGKDYNASIKVDRNASKSSKKNLWGWAYGMSDYLLITAQK